MRWLNKIDRYILGKFFSTFFFTLLLFMVIVMIFDIEEKLDDFSTNHAPFLEIAIYYCNFIPFFAIFFTPLFLFVSTIFFSSRMANNSEFVAMTGAGITFNRLMRPFLIGALIITIFDIYANYWLVPQVNKNINKFLNHYVTIGQTDPNGNIHMQLSKNQYVYLQNYFIGDSSGYRFSSEQIDNGDLTYKITAEKITWRGKKQAWELNSYMERWNNGMNEKLRLGKDTLVKYPFTPKDITMQVRDIPTLNYSELKNMISAQRLRGAGDLAFYEVEMDKRLSFPFSILILTVIAFALSTRRVRGGIGLQIGIGITLSFAYILFMQFSTTYSTNGNLPAIIGVWIPNVIFGGIAYYLYRTAPK